MKEIYILGIGHNTPVFIDLVEACGYKVMGLYHFEEGRTGEFDHGYPIIGTYDDLWSMSSLKNMYFALSQGNNAIRKEVFRKIVSKRGIVPTLVHPKADVSRFAKLGKGTIVHIGSVVHPDVVIGDNTIISYNSSITHSSQIGDNCYLALGTLVGAYVKIEDNVFIGIGANLISGKVDRVGHDSYIGAGALVTKSVEPYTVVAGFPAKVIKKLSRD